MTDPLPPDLAAAISGDRLERIRFFADIGSTNDVALSLAEQGAPEGSVVLADTQHAGRGRRGRTWFSPPGAGIYASMVVRPATPAEFTLLTLAAGVATAAAVRRATGLSVELKWPNDVVIGRPWRKMGGVLCESVGAGASIEAVIVGIGLNLRPAAYPPEVADRATSIETELGRAVDRGPVVAALVDEVDAVIDRLRHGQRHAICDDWRARAEAGIHGAAVRWHDQGVTRSGVARDIDEDGALLVQADDRLVRVVSGEVTWERLSRD